MKRYTISSIVNKIFGRIEHIFTSPRLRLFKTIYVNFRSLPPQQAIHFPIYVYGRVKLYSLTGPMEIQCSQVHKGMIKIGVPMHGSVIDTHISCVRNWGKIVFCGKVTICNGVALNICGGELMLYNEVLIGENTRIVCTNSIIVKEGARIAHETQIIDSNFHFMLDTNKHTIRYPKGKIEIGKWCWVGNKTTISKGTVLPDYTIVGSGSLLNKDYTKDVPCGAIIGGTPAKLIKSGYRRIFKAASEKTLNKFFEENGQNSQYIYNGEDIDNFCHI